MGTGQTETEIEGHTGEYGSARVPSLINLDVAEKFEGKRWKVR